MSFKRPLPPPLTHPPTNNGPCESIRTNICYVCGDNAHIANYGILSCPSCKTFFRRHGFQIKNDMRCRFNGHCQIDVLTRRNCTACRFAKCLKVGMCPELIRKEDLFDKNKRFKDLLQTPATRSLARPLPLNLLSNDHSSLNKYEWTLLSNVVHAGDRFSPIAKAQSIMNYIHDHASLKHSCELISSIYSSFEAFISCTADFRVMTTGEQCSLIHRNLHSLWGFHSIFTFREVGVFDNLTNQNAVATIYSPAHVQSTKNLTENLDPDATLAKLMLVVLAFSSNSSGLVMDETASNDILLHGTYRLFGSQSVYVEMMWKYMMYRYGHAQSVRRFSSLIKTVLNILTLMSEIYDSNYLHQKLSEAVTEQTERSLAIGAHESVPLWGKS